MRRHQTLSACGAERRRILLVEDHEAMRVAVAELIETDRRLAVWAATGSAEEALERLETGWPDLAVVDLDLPGMQGLELVAELHRRSPELPVLVLSSHPADRYETAALDAGALGYLPKERAAFELVELVDELLGLPSGSGPVPGPRPPPSRDRRPARPHLVEVPPHRPAAR